MIAPALTILLLVLSGILYFDQEGPIFGRQFSVTREQLAHPEELLLLSELLQGEGNMKGALLCWKLLKDTQAPWKFRGPALLRLASYYRSKGKKDFAKECLQLVIQQNEDLAAKLAAQEKFGQLDQYGSSFSSDEEL